jgi:hypothetical protein
VRQNYHHFSRALKPHFPTDPRLLAMWGKLDGLMASP